ncbi:hypothetical protein ACWD7F_04010 [Streptomyces sp. NPDC005122]
MSKTQVRTDTSPNGQAQQGKVARAVTPPRVSARRRRPGVIALSLALIAAGGAGVAVLLLQVGHRTEVVTVVRDVQVGQVLTEADLGTASVALDPAVNAVRPAPWTRWSASGQLWSSSPVPSSPPHRSRKTYW